MPVCMLMDLCSPVVMLQARAAVLRSVWRQLEYAIAESFYDFAASYVHGVCAEAEHKPFDHDPLQEVSLASSPFYFHLLHH